MHLNQPSAHVNHSLSGGDDREGEPLPQIFLLNAQRKVAIFRNMNKLQKRIDIEGWHSPRGDAMKNLMAEAIRLLLMESLPEPKKE